MEYLKKVAIYFSLIISLLVSFSFAISAVIGYYLGRFFTKRIFDGKGRLRPIFLRIGNWQVHFHHWFISLSIVFSSLVLGYYRFIPLAFYGFLGGLTIQDIYWDRKLYKKHIYWADKWYKIIARMKDR